MERDLLCVWERKGMEMWGERLWSRECMHSLSILQPPLSLPPASTQQCYLLNLAFHTRVFLMCQEISLSQPALHSWHTAAPDLSIVSWAPDLKASNVNFLMNANDIQLHSSFQTFHPWGTFCTQTISQISITERMANTCSYQSRSRSAQFFQVPTRFTYAVGVLTAYLELLNHISREKSTPCYLTKVSDTDHSYFSSFTKGLGFSFGFHSWLLLLTFPRDTNTVAHLQFKFSA